MPVPSAISELSQTAGSNYPAGSESPSTADDYLRTYAAFIATLRDGKGFTAEATVASAATADIGAANSLYVQITGTTTITSFGTTYSGPRFIRFAGALTLTHNATSLILPGGANITTAAGDTCIAVPQSAGWRILGYQRGGGVPFSTGQLAGLRNKIINGNFGVNQRGASSASTAYAAGAYVMDRWKAGAGGCTLSFATSANVTTVTITAGTLVQVVEGNNLQSGTHVLSWSGTATARIDSGGYSASGVTGTATGGTNLSVEFGTGTVSKVQLEEGSQASAFEQRPHGLELALCQRYYCKTYDYSAAPGSVTNAGAIYSVTTSTAAGTAPAGWDFPADMRTTPTITFYNPATGATGTWRTGAATNVAVNAPLGAGSRRVAISNNGTATADSAFFGHAVASAEL